MQFLRKPEQTRCSLGKLHCSSLLYHPYAGIARYLPQRVDLTPVQAWPTIEGGRHHWGREERCGGRGLYASWGTTGTMAERILVVEDDRRIRDLLRRSLIFEGYEVDTAEDGETALRCLRESVPDAVILDLMLPGIDGLEVCRRLRKASTVPILILTARDAVSDRVTGLDAGADDYMVKPFALDELLARLRALFRRHRLEATPEVLRYADLTLNPRTRQVFRGEDEIQLTAKEFDLLELFMRHPSQVLTRELIYEHIWNYDFGGESNIIEVYVRYLRAKLEAGGKPRLIQTVRGVGYTLREQSS